MNTGPIDCTAKVEGVAADHWDGIVGQFDDARLYQTWGYGAARWGEAALSHLLLRQDDRIVAAAQVAVIKLPLLYAGLAYVKWGPMWRLRGRPEDPNIYRRMLRALKEQYAGERGLLLRIMPQEIDDAAGAMRALMAEEGLRPLGGDEVYRTYRVDLMRPMEQIRAELKRKWRANLRRAETQDLEILEPREREAVDTFLALYDDMHGRKRFDDGGDIDIFPRLQRELPEPLRLQVLICRHRGEPVAGLACSVIGDTGLAVFGATSAGGLQLGASYLLDWTMIQRLKASGCRWYDLGGARALSVNQYKSGLAGRHAEPVDFLCKFETGGDLASRAVARFGPQLSRGYRRVKTALQRP